MTEKASESMESPQFTLRPIGDAEVEEAFGIIDEEGWNLVLDKFKLIHQAFGNSIYVAVSKDGQLAGTTSLIPTRQGECVLGNLVVARKFRKMGLGSWMLTRASQMQPDSTPSLLSVEGSTGFYRKCGYKETGEYHRIIYMQAETEEVEEKIKSMSGSKNFTVKPYTPDMFEAVRGYDNDQRGYDIGKFLSVLTKCADLFVATLESTGDVVGYVTAYQKGQNVIFDGLYADSDEIALHLFWNILKAFPEREAIKIQLFDSRSYLSTLGRRIEEKSETYTRMATNGTASLTPSDKVYSIIDCDYT